MHPIKYAVIGPQAKHIPGCNTIVQFDNVLHFDASTYCGWDILSHPRFLNPVCLSVCLTVHNCTVGWSDIALFAIYQNRHIAADQVKVNSEKSPSLTAHARQSFHFSKFTVTGTLKINNVF